MKKVLCFLVLVMMIFSQFAMAQSMVSTKKKNLRSVVKMTSFPDYPPFSEKSVMKNSNILYTLFDSGLELFAKSGDYKLEYVVFDDYEKAIENVRQGNVDLALGIYYATEMYSGLQYIYPAALHNPVHVVMLPQNISSVENVDDLKKMKGIYIQSEYFSDYMMANFKNFAIEPVATPYEAYEQLFTGKVDFIVGSYYFNYAYVLRTGLKDYVAFSKESLWNMPLFFGVSKASENSSKVAVALKQFVVTEPFKQSISSKLQEKIHKIEEESRGVVPPKFVRVESLQEVTPADEQNLPQSSEAVQE